MFAPDYFGSSGGASDSDRLTGSLVVTFALIATAEVGRSVRLLNVLFGIWLVLSPWVLDGATAASRWNDLVLGAALIVLSLPRGHIRGEYGNWQPYIR